MTSINLDTNVNQNMTPGDVPDEQQNSTIRTEVKEDSDTLERVLHHVGEMGTYQWLLFGAMLPFGMSWAFVYFGQMFITATPQMHWCHVSQLRHLIPELRRNLSIPGAVEGSNLNHCRMYDANWTQVLETMTPPDPSTSTIACMDGWEYEFGDIPYHTVVSERHWVCENDWKVPFTQTMAFLGSIVGSLLFGRLADVFGRIPILIGSNVIGVIGNLATIFTKDVWDFTLARFVVGMSCDTCFMAMYILVLEYVGTKHRTWVGNMSIALYFGSGCLLLPWLAIWISNWRLLLMYTSLPMLTVLIAPCIIPESARWLASRGLIDGAVKILKRFERINRTKIPDNVLDEFVASSNTTKESNQSVLVIFKYASMRIVLLYMVVVYVVCALVFDGLIRLSENLGTDFFITFTLTSATEIPSLLLVVFFLDRWGRRWLSFGSMIICGLFSIAAAFIPRGTTSVAFAISARFFMNMSYCVAIQWAPEILPTSVRASGVSLMHVSGYIAAMLSPFVVYSERAWYALPLLVVGIASVIGGGVSLMLPETRGRAMPQTMREGERLARTRCCGKTKDDVNDVTRNRTESYNERPDEIPNM